MYSAYLYEIRGSTMYHQTKQIYKDCIKEEVLEESGEPNIIFSF